MYRRTLITNARIVNEGHIFKGSVLIENEIIAGVFDDPAPAHLLKDVHLIVDAANSFLLPGLIDDQVHFREPGLTHKGEIFTESRAAVAGGITSFMEMPNTNPQATTRQLLEEKFELGARKSMANYSFYMGATNDNLAEIITIDPSKVCGVKVFMGASTGNMLVDNEEALEKIFTHSPALVATHCEDEATIKKNLEEYMAIFGEDILASHHPRIRNHLACLLSSTKAVKLARKFKTRLHVLHLSTAVETALFDNSVPLGVKDITAEVCVHHLWFTSTDYVEKQNFIKWNPAIKNISDRETLWFALLNGTIDVVATDHAPHTVDEKINQYRSAPSGGPLVQHSLQAMADALMERNLPLHHIAQWMGHNPALCFKVHKRGFIREGYYADLVILNTQKPYTVHPDNILYKCSWSPFERITFKSTPTHTFVNGTLVYENGKFDETYRGKALEFSR